MSNTENNSSFRTSFIEKPGRGYAIAGLSLGIIGLLLLLSGLPFVSFVIGIVGVVMSSIAKRHGYDGGMIVAGKIMSILSIIFGIIITVIFILAIIGLFVYGGSWLTEIINNSATIQETAQAI